jgi:hypothetical protein
MYTETLTLLAKASRLADLIVSGSSDRMSFQSEQQFLALLALQPPTAPLRVDRADSDQP